MSINLNVAAPLPAIDVEEKIVTVFRYEGSTYVTDADGASQLRFAERSQMLTDMPAAQGRTKLPFSLTSLRIWQDAVGSMEPTGLSIEWLAGCRAEELCTLVTVSEFLRDEEALACATAVLAQGLGNVVQQGDESFIPDPWGNTTAQRDSLAMDPIFKAMSALHSSLQTAVFSSTPAPLCSLVPLVPDEMLSALLERHLHAGKLNISKQLFPACQRSRSPLTPPLDSLSQAREGACRLPLRALLPTLTSLPPLSSLDMSQNSIFHDATEDGISVVASILDTHSSTLDSFSLSESPTELRTRDSSWTSSNLRIQDSRACTPAAVSMWQALSQCSSLTKLDIAYQPLHPSQCQQLSSILPKLSGLSELDLSGSFNHETRDSKMLQALILLPNLTALALADNKLYAGNWGSGKLLNSLQRLPKLERLDIRGNLCRSFDLLATVAVVACMPSMRSLTANRMMSFSMTKHDRFEVEASAEALCSKINASLTDPDLISDPGQQQTTTEDYEVLPPSVANLTSLSMHEFTSSCKVLRLLLRFLSLKFSWVADANGFKKLAILPTALHAWSLLDTLQNVELLDFSGVSIGYAAESHDCLARFIGSLRSLRTLNLSSCLLPPTSLVQICDTLSKKIFEAEVVGITSLDWSSNQKFLGADLMGSICGVGTLQRLVLQNCGVSADQAKELGKQMPGQLMNLTSLDLSRNRICIEGVEAVSHGCKYIGSVKYLHCGIAVGDEDLVGVASSILGESVTIKQTPERCDGNVSLGVAIDAFDE